MAQVSSTHCGCLQRPSPLPRLCSPSATLVTMFNDLLLLQQALAREEKVKQDKGIAVGSLQVKLSQHAHAQ